MGSWNRSLLRAPTRGAPTVCDNYGSLLGDCSSAGGESGIAWDDVVMSIALRFRE